MLSFAADHAKPRSSDKIRQLGTYVEPRPNLNPLQFFGPSTYSLLT